MGRSCTICTCRPVAFVPLLAAATAAVAALRLTTGAAWDVKTSRILGALSSAAAAVDALITELASIPLTLLPGLAAVLHRISAQYASWRAEVDGWLTVPWAETVQLGSFSLGVSVPYDTPFAVAGVGSAPAAAYAAPEDDLTEEKGGVVLGRQLGLHGGRGSPPRRFGLGRRRVRGFRLESLPLSVA